ncbi:Hypothetical protein, putative [Bodo saltans]|uniref:JmjC domain-containing protein n=1 Tax=Bodo saltans TaxID=75058 RepID=A0A0S4JMT2_BODSA|nr:Hypothetical protein, putative [Bodo saltans]|eukprot:CUG91553.1 Hypothetical protein, putative [Bodo saltans]
MSKNTKPQQQRRPGSEDQGADVSTGVASKKKDSNSVVSALVVILVLLAYIVAAVYPALNAPRPGTPEGSSSLLFTRAVEAGWKPEDIQRVDSTFCNIPRIPMSSLSRAEFQDRYLEKAPVILVGTPNSDNTFAKMTQRQYLLDHFGNHSITLSSANRNSYDKKEVAVHHYLDRRRMMKPQTLHTDGASTWYHFGDNKHDQWEDVFQHYTRPTEYTFGQYSSLSFGLGPAGSGVPFHTHGHVFNEVIYGKKRWWLQAPVFPLVDDIGPRFDPDASSLQWLEYVRPTYSPAETDALHECVCAPGETLYIPSFWHHSTLNIGETVFMAVFV